MAWKKVLYEKQAYADNYVEPEQFLDGLRKNCEFFNLVNELSTPFLDP